MSQTYSQYKAFLAIAKAALRSIAKSPSSVIFTLAFPLVFILVFGFLGGSGVSSIKVGIDPATDTTMPLMQALAKVDGLKLTASKSLEDLQKDLKKGTIQALLNVQPKSTAPFYSISIRTTAADRSRAEQLEGIIRNVLADQDPEAKARLGQLMNIEQTVIASRKFKTIDFILPGQLGFSLLAASVFGTAFVFYNLRQGLVLKRFFATPVRREFILLGEGVARMIFQLLGALFIILVGYFALGYTLINGVTTLLNMLLLCMIGLLVFMSFGFVISGLARSESTIPPLANMLTLPQFLLAGTFFSVEAFPKWLQPVSKMLPLTYLNDALREVGFEGASLWDVRLDIGVLLLWGVIGYFLASRLFKWE